MAFIIKRSFPLTLVLQQSVIWSSRREGQEAAGGGTTTNRLSPTVSTTAPPHLIYCPKRNHFQFSTTTRFMTLPGCFRLRNSSKRSITVRKGETATCLTDRPKVFALKSQFSHIFATPVAYFRAPPWQGSLIF